MSFKFCGKLLDLWVHSPVCFSVQHPCTSETVYTSTERANLFMNAQDNNKIKYNELS